MVLTRTGVPTVLFNTEPSVVGSEGCDTSLVFGHKMANEVDMDFELCLSTLMGVTEKSGNLRHDLKQDIRNAVRSLRKIYNELNNNIIEKSNAMQNLQTEVAAKEKVSRTQSSKKLFSEALTGAKMDKSESKIFKMHVKSKNNQSTEYIKTLIKTKLNPVEMKVGINAMKALKNGHVLIESANKEEIATICSSINEKCGLELEANASKLRKPRMIIFNVPEDISVENASGGIVAQNPELNLSANEIIPKFIFEDRKKMKNLIIEVNSETRNIIKGKRLKIGWNICNNDDYLKISRCFKCSKYNHRAKDCHAEVTCPKCAGNHTLRECRSQQLKCINCCNYNKYNKNDVVDENHSSLDSSCKCYQMMLKRYIANTDY